MDKYLTAGILTILIGTFLALMILLWGCSSIKRTPMIITEGYIITVRAIFSPSEEPIKGDRNISGMAECAGNVMRLKADRYEGKILAEDVFAVGFEFLNVLHCQYPDKFANVELLPDGWNE